MFAGNSLHGKLKVFPTTLFHLWNTKRYKRGKEKKSRFLQLQWKFSSRRLLILDRWSVVRIWHSKPCTT